MRIAKSPRHHPRRIVKRLPKIGESLAGDRKSTRLNSSHVAISYAVFCLKKKKRACTRVATTYYPVCATDTGGSPDRPSRHLRQTRVPPALLHLPLRTTSTLERRLRPCRS